MRSEVWKIFAFAIILAFSVACQKKKAQSGEPSQAALAKKIPFVPSPDSLVTLAQLKTWIACNTFLDSLTYLYADSFQTDDARARIRRQESFIAAQDMICVRSGLSGGYDEYLWIRKCMALAKNKAVLDSSGMQMY